ncbi:hypothetical protein KY335_02325 [Candidatus Woesearchaeota archaeon]|nr:hypothetical protein [Candidatus Woesearchaeota archaeon]
MELEHIGDKLYVGEATKGISIPPEEIAYGRYILPNTLGHSEHEDIGARIVEASREKKQWVGVAYSRLADQLIEELTAMADRDKKAREAWENRPGFLRSIYNTLYNGFKALVVPSKTGAGSEPSDQVEETEEKIEKKFSVLAFQLYTQGPRGPEILGYEIRTMADKGYLELVDIDEENTVLVPTQKFVETVHGSQRR